MFLDKLSPQVEAHSVISNNRAPKIHIKFASPEAIRARKVVRRSNCGRTGKWPGWKAKRTMHWESEHEGNAMILLDASFHIVNFAEQPCVIFFEMNGQPFRHFPDLLVNCDANYLCEVKTRKDSLHPDILERTQFLSRHLPAHGFYYHMFVAEDLANEIRLDNARQILKYGRIEISHLDRERIRQLFLVYETLPWGALQFDQENPNLPRHICRLILEGVLSFDIDKELDESTPIRWVFENLAQGDSHGTL